MPRASFSQRVIRAWCRTTAARQVDLTVDGLGFIPKEGPGLIVCRHVHHLYDGCALLATISRPLSVLVALDWVRGQAARWLMEWACAAARWPVVLRADGLHWQAIHASSSAIGAYGLHEVRGYLRRGISDAVNLLVEGQLLAIFPEAYPNIDPSFTPKTTTEAFLPFRPGFAKLVELAERKGERDIPIIPVGFIYEPGRRLRVTLRFGAPIFRAEGRDRQCFVRAVEAQVRMLSANPQAPRILS